MKPAVRASATDATPLLERFRAKWIPVRVKKTLRNKKPELRLYSVKAGTAFYQSRDGTRVRTQLIHQVMAAAKRTAER